ncbi:gamma-glutamylcyclotransferase family protein [Actinomadura hibisca]|uniref:gamma-glutamylcyclotransferase family protein n=1 Tax=Actinomadura hibisca TaxID=68565 RepID=UPI000831D676|nr:gamma-glutamylcyclotransferase family protein [Actinomadura hibisca]
MNDLFVYGTLRYPEILQVLLGRVPDLAPATAPGWRVSTLPGLVYPGLVADPAATADGMLISGLTNGERALLDAYEDGLYEAVLLSLSDGRQAHAYAWKGDTEPFDWDPARFAAEELAAFTVHCRTWRLSHPR